MSDGADNGRVSPNAEDRHEGWVGSGRRKMPINRSGITTKLEIYSVTGGTHEGYITANVNEDGQVGEIFLAGFGKEGSTLYGWTQVAAVLFSIALQWGAEMPMMLRKLGVMSFEPYGPTNDPEIPYCRSVPDYISRWLALRFGDEELRASILDESQRRRSADQL